MFGEIMVDINTDVQTCLYYNLALGDSSLKEDLEARRHHAEEKMSERTRAHAELFEDGDEVLERIFGSLTGLIHASLMLVLKRYMYVLNFT